MKKLFERRFHRVPEVICFAPGRVNLIGEHTDYNGGHVFPCAIHLGIRCAAAKRTDRELHFYSENCREVGERAYSLDALSNQGAWSDYPAGVVRAFEAFGYSLQQGADFVFFGDLPEGLTLSCRRISDTVIEKQENVATYYEAAVELVDGVISENK